MHISLSFFSGVRNCVYRLYVGLFFVIIIFKMFEKESKKIQVKENTKVIKNEVSVKKMGLGDALELVQLEQAIEVTSNA